MSSANAISPWAGQKLSEEPIALLPDSPSGPLVAGSSDYTGVVSVEPEQIDAFVNRHADSVFLSVDVANLFWKLDFLLPSTMSGQSRIMLRQLVEEGRWIDVLLLCDQVNRAYEMRGRPMPRQITQSNAIAARALPDKITCLIRLFKRLSCLSQLLTKDAMPVLPFQNYDLLARQKQPKILRIK